MDRARTRQTRSAPDPSEFASVVRREEATPLYVQIAANFRRRIACGEWPPHFRLPPEPELAAGLGISRGTLRAALRHLAGTGLLVQVQGRGTFVTPRTIEAPIARDLLSLAETLESQGIEYHTTLLSHGVQNPPPVVAALLALPVGSQATRIERLRLVHDQPIALLRNVVSQSICGTFNEWELATQSLFRLIERQAGLPIATGRRTFEALAAPDDIALALGLAPGAPALYVEQVTYLEDGRPVEYSDIWIRSDRLKLSSLLSRRGFAQANG